MLAKDEESVDRASEDGGRGSGWLPGKAAHADGGADSGLDIALNNSFLPDPKASDSLMAGSFLLDDHALGSDDAFDGLGRAGVALGESGTHPLGRTASASRRSSPPESKHSQSPSGTGRHRLVVDMREVPSDTMHLLLDYCYTGVLRMAGQPPRSAVHLMLAAERYGMGRLRDRLARLALRAVDEENALDLLQVAERGHSPVLRGHVMQFILRHAEGVLASPAAPKISLELATQLLSSDDLCIQSEELLFRFVLRWGLAHQPERQDLRSTVLPLVSRLRLGHLSIPSLRHRTCTGLAPPDMITAALFAKVRWAHETMERRADVVAARTMSPVSGGAAGAAGAAGVVKARPGGSPGGRSVRFHDSVTSGDGPSEPPSMHLGAILRRGSTISGGTHGNGNGTGALSPTSLAQMAGEQDDEETDEFHRSYDTAMRPRRYGCLLSSCAMRSGGPGAGAGLLLGSPSGASGGGRGGDSGTSWLSTSVRTGRYGTSRFCAVYPPVQPAADGRDSVGEGDHCAVTVSNGGRSVWWRAQGDGSRGSGSMPQWLWAAAAPCVDAVRYPGGYVWQLTIEQWDGMEGEEDEGEGQDEDGRGGGSSAHGKGLGSGTARESRGTGGSSNGGLSASDGTDNRLMPAAIALVEVQGGKAGAGPSSSSDPVPQFRFPAGLRQDGQISGKGKGKSAGGSSQSAKQNGPQAALRELKRVFGERLLWSSSSSATTGGTLAAGKRGARLGKSDSESESSARPLYQLKEGDTVTVVLYPRSGGAGAGAGGSGGSSASMGYEVLWTVQHSAHGEALYHGDNLAEDSDAEAGSYASASSALYGGRGGVQEEEEGREGVPVLAQSRVPEQIGWSLLAGRSDGGLGGPVKGIGSEGPVKRGSISGVQGSLAMVVLLGSAGGSTCSVTLSPVVPADVLGGR